MNSTVTISDTAKSSIAGTLYHDVQPIGKGTDQVESLGSYMHRLAMAHCVQARDIVKYLLSMFNLKEFRNGLSFYGQGVNTQAGRIDLVPFLHELISIATQREDLQGLSLSIWSDVMTTNHMYRESMAWCPLCMKEQYANHETFYEPLVWTFRAIDKCTIHNIFLETVCGECGHTPWYFEKGIVLGYCPKCHASLSEANYRKVDGMTSDVAIADSIFRLIMATKELDERPQQSCIPQVLEQAKILYFRGNGSELARQIGVEDTLLQKNYITTHLPKINYASQLAYFFGVPIEQLLNNKHLNRVLFLIKEASIASPDQWDQQKVKSTLCQYEVVYPPLSLRSIAKEIGYNRSILSKHFPEVCSKLSEIHMRYRISKKGYQIKDFVNKSGYSDAEKHRIKSNLLELFYTLNPPESLSSISIRLGMCSKTLKKLFPEICSEIVNKYIAHTHEHRLFKGSCKTYTRKELGDILRNCIEDVEICSPNQIAVKLGLNKYMIKREFPYEYEVLMQRLLEKRLKERDKRIDKIKFVVKELSDSGIYPSQQKVSSKVGFNFNITDKAYLAWRNALNEIGFLVDKK